MQGRPESASVTAWHGAAGIFILLLCNYLLSAPRGVLLDDDGYFILAAWSGGVAHPPGYPLYTLLAGLFTHLPLGSVAFRVHACSALFAALACAVLWCVTLRLTASRFAAWVAALCYGFSGTFWSQAIVAEVYSLNAFLFFLLLLLCMDAGRDGAHARPGILRGACISGLFGLSLANHWPLMLLSTPALLAAAWPRRRVLAPRPVLLLLPLCIGLLPYAWMVYRSRVAEIAFLGPIEGWGDFWSYLGRRVYADVDHSQAAGWADKLRYAGFALMESARQFGWPGIALAAGGFWVQWRRWPVAWCWSLTLGFAGSTLVLACLLGFDWDLLHRNTFAVYPLVAHGIAAIWLGFGAVALLAWMERRITGATPAPLLRGALALLIVGGVWLQHAPTGYRGNDQWATEYANALLGALRPDASLFVYGDYATGPLAYAHHILSVRPDVELYSPVGQLFANRLFPPLAATAAQSAAAIDGFIAGSSRPIYYNLVLPHHQGVIRHGLFFEVGRELPAGMNQAQLAPEVDQYFVRMFERGEPRDVSQLIHYRQLGALYCRTLAVLSARARHAAVDARLARYCGGFYGLLARAETLLDQDPASVPRALALLQLASARAAEAVSVQNLATLDHLFARAYLSLGRRNEALQWIRRSLARWPDPSNPAYAFVRMPD